MFYIGNQWQFLRKNYYFLRFCMKYKLIGDFSGNSYKYYLKETADISGLLFNLQFTGYEEIQKNYHLFRSEYESFMLTYTICGDSNMIYDGKYYHVVPDSLMFLDCMNSHEHWANPQGYKIYFIHVYSPTLKNFCKYIQSLASPVIPTNNDSIGFCDFVKEVHKSIAEGTFTQEEFSGQLYKILLKLKTLVEKNTKKPLYAPDYINKLILYISSHYTQKLTLNSCAEYINVSPTYLESVFSKYTGFPLAKYVANFRFEKSKYLLVTTNDPISKIAQDVGLEDSQVLIRLFKRNLGITPLTYRKQHEKEVTYGKE